MTAEEARALVPHGLSTAIAPRTEYTFQVPGGHYLKPSDKQSHKPSLYRHRFTQASAHVGANVTLAWFPFPPGSQ